MSSKFILLSILCLFFTSCGFKGGLYRDKEIKKTTSNVGVN